MPPRNAIARSDSDVRADVVGKLRVPSIAAGNGTRSVPTTTGSSPVGTGQNLRITIGGSGTVFVDGSLNPGSLRIVGAAYSNNVPGAVTSTLYVIDSDSDRLLTQIPPNMGTLNDIGPLGFDTNDLVDFDISRDSGIAFASLTPPTGAQSQLFTINLNTGAASLIGSIGSGLLRDITVAQVPIPEPANLVVWIGLLATGLATRVASVRARNARIA